MLSHKARRLNACGTHTGATVEVTVVAAMLDGMTEEIKASVTFA